MALPRQIHQQRVGRLQPRFSPIFTGSDTPTATVLPAAPASPAPFVPPGQRGRGGEGDQGALPPVVPPPAPPVPPPAPAPPAPAPVAAPPSSVAAITSAPAVPTVPSTLQVQKTPTLVATPTSLAAPSLITPSSIDDLPSLSSSDAIPNTSRLVSPSQGASSASSKNTGAVVGIAAGAIVGVVAIGVLGYWAVKRWFQDRDDEDDPREFNRNTWMRNSVAVPDDMPQTFPRSGPSESPRPPTMIERKQHNLSNLAMSPAPFGHDSTHTGYQESPYPSMRGPGQYPGTPSPSQAYFSPIAPVPPQSPGMASVDETIPPMQHANMPVYFSRHDSEQSAMSAAPSRFGAYPDIPNPHERVSGDGYTTLDRKSVSSHQAEQYAAIPRPSTVPPPLPEKGYIPQAPSPFADPVAYQEVAVVPSGHGNVDPMPPPNRVSSPVDSNAPNVAIAQLANAFPRAPHNSMRASAFAPPMSPRNVALPASPSSAVFTHTSNNSAGIPASLTPGVATPGTQPGHDLPVQDAHPHTAQAATHDPVHGTNAAAPAAHTQDTGYDNEDAYGGI